VWTARKGAGGVVHLRGGQGRRRLRRGNCCRHDSSRRSSRGAMRCSRCVRPAPQVIFHGAWTDPSRRRCDVPRCLCFPVQKTARTVLDGRRSLAGSYLLTCLLTSWLAARIACTLMGHLDRLPVATSTERPRWPVVTVFVVAVTITSERGGQAGSIFETPRPIPLRFDGGLGVKRAAPTRRLCSPAQLSGDQRPRTRYVLSLGLLPVLRADCDPRPDLVEKYRTRQLRSNPHK
jgi:hypothetical protein